ncbi:DUF1573 domain-containing protein [Thermoflexibacter ruber]|uniref:DUF1573 domain-containing protein n=1 Tax=Thermoflexibacter ruber TaxID=1003 RepID=A0A1I2BZL8_9BACT|nr:DUF1573 domain-containing protein [Thermoflexibacter ruber]SFE61549.1 Protein of unknown function [Thermoflexibacter ruber]
MKKYLLLLICLCYGVLGFAQNNTTNISNENVPILSFHEKEYDFGDIKQGDVVEHTFSFKNTGKTPLIIANVQTTCGCTATKWTNQPIPPDAEGSITVQFNTSGKQGIQNKVITIKSNANNQIERVIIKANILLKEN